MVAGPHSSAAIARNVFVTPSTGMQIRSGGVVSASGAVLTDGDDTDTGQVVAASPLMSAVWVPGNWTPEDETRKFESTTCSVTVRWFTSITPVTSSLGRWNIVSGCGTGRLSKTVW